MTALNVKLGHTKGYVVAANPIYLTSDPRVPNGSAFTFELRTEDAGGLDAYIGEFMPYALGAERPFWGCLIDLEQASPTASGLVALGELRVTRARMQIMAEEGAPQ